MAASLVKRRYTSAVYEDKYFPEKNAAIPFKWETSPGKPKYDDDDDDESARKDDDKQGSCMHNMCMQASHHIHTPHIAHAMSIYPLRPPPNVGPASPLRVKDLLLHRGICDHDLSDDQFDDQLPQLSPHDHRCPLHAYPHRFPRLSIRFRSLKSSTVVPVYKNHCLIDNKRSHHPGVDRSQAASPALVVHAPFQGRSQSFSHAAKHGTVADHAKRAANYHGCNVVGDASVQLAPGRRCNSFNLQSARHAVIDHDNKVTDDDDDDSSSMAAAAVWAGACILAAAAAHDAVSANHHQNDPCRVAMKLRDLLQQSANFSEFQLPTMRKLKKGGGSTIDENVAQLALSCHGKTARAEAAKRKAKSEEEEAMEAFLREGITKSCTHDDDDIVEEEPTKEKVSTLEGDEIPCKLVQRKGFLKVFKNECIACWCPSPTF